MLSSNMLLLRQGRRLLQMGVVLFLFTSFEGFAVPYFAAPNLGRSVHTLSAFSGILLIALGLVWPRFELGATAGRVLVPDLFGHCDHCGFPDRSRLGSRELDHAVGGGLRTRQRLSGSHDCARDVSGGADRYRCVCAHSLGPSHGAWPAAMNIMRLPVHRALAAAG